MINQTYFINVISEDHFQCCDYFSYPVIISILGNVLMATCLLLVGPVPFLNLTPSNNLFFICGALIGFGNAQVKLKSNDSRVNLNSKI